MSATCGDYALPENYIWSVADATMMIGIFVILFLAVVGLAIFDYMLSLDQDRVQALFGFFMKRPSVTLAIFSGFNRLDPKGIRGRSLWISWNRMVTNCQRMRHNSSKHTLCTST